MDQHGPAWTTMDQQLVSCETWCPVSQRSVQYGFSHVFDSLREVAVKQVPYENHKTREITLLENIRHSCIVGLLDSGLVTKTMAGPN